MTPWRNTKKHWSRRAIVLGAIASTFLGPTPFAIAAPPPAYATPQQVDDTIEKAKAFIYGQMKGDNWETAGGRDPKGKVNDVAGGQYGGLTALATYALLAAGESPQDPRILKAIDFLLKADMIGTYAVGFRCQVWLNIPKNDTITAAIAKDAKLLLAGRRTRGPEKGLYHYAPAPPSATDTDHSCSQYGVLGLWACSEVPELVPDSFWDDSDTVWRQDQGEDGSWAYMQRPGALDPKGNIVKGSPSMTAAGIATLFITQDFRFRGRGSTCSGNIVDKNLDLGLKWFTDFYKSGGKGLSAYAFYGVERIGVASGYKYFGDTDWYQNGATSLVRNQLKDGSYKAEGVCPILPDTCFALLFLSRGRAPVMMNKLNYASDTKLATWDERPRDCSNIVRWVGKQTENDLNWQITTLASPVEDWHDSPILYITGDQALKFSEAEKQKLKTFVQQGGLIVGNADCGKTEFANSFKDIGKEIFSDYEFKPLAASSTLLHDEQFDGSKWKHPVPVLAMDNGARELMMLIPDADPSKAWQFQQSTGHEELYQFAANLFLYSVDKDGLAPKGDTYIVVPDPKIKPTKTIDIQRITYAGNADPEPGGWKRLNAILHNGDHVDLKMTMTAPEKLSGKTIAHLTGTGSFKLNEEAIAGIKTFIQAGGTLVVDAAGGNPDFVDSADRVLKQVFDDADYAQLKIPLPKTEALYTTGGPIGDIMYRAYARNILGSMKGPQLRGVKQNGRLVCIFSHEDLSVGMVGEPVDGIIGYSPATATSLMRKIVLYASGTKPLGTGATTAPVVVKKPASKPAAK